MKEVIRLTHPLPQARYIIFYSYRMNKQEAVDSKEEVEYYSSIDIQEGLYPQTILAYEMNDKSLPDQYGAPLRLRMETKLGYKMVKSI